MHLSRWLTESGVVEMSADGIRMKRTNPRDTNSFKQCPSYKFVCDYVTPPTTTGPQEFLIFQYDMHGHAWSAITDESRAVEVCVVFEGAFYCSIHMD